MQNNNLNYDKFEPMLACSETVTVDQVKYPCYVTPKLDGVRVCRVNGVVLTRRLKPIANQALRNMLNSGLPDYADAEITVADKGFHDIQSAVMTINTSVPPNIRVNIFDMIIGGGYTYRMFMLREIVCDENKPPWLHVILPTQVNNPVELQNIHDKHEKDGYEGTIIRSPLGAYKFGRSTMAEGLLLKLVTWNTDDAIVVGFEEAMYNKKPGTYRQKNLVPLGTLGAFVVKRKDSDITFNVGSGFSHAFAQYVWNNKHLFLGKTLTYKHKKHGALDRPRHPIFIGMRPEMD